MVSQSAEVEAVLNWIRSQADTMLDLAKSWSEINSYSFHLEGLHRQAEALKIEFSSLGQVEEITLPPFERMDPESRLWVHTPLGKALRIRKRPEAKLQLLLSGHMDTVFGPDHDFQTVRLQENGTWNGPGIIDMKGGLVVILYVLKAIEQLPFSHEIGWECLISPDEEIGSPCSGPLWVESAQRHHVGLVFEPAHPDGTLVSGRKGSSTYTLMAKGKSAHVGRAFHEGINAIDLMMDFTMALEQFARKQKELICNVGWIQGGGPVNVVPDHGACRFNFRTVKPEQQAKIEAWMLKKIEEIHERYPGALTLYPEVSRPPKHFDRKTQTLYERLQGCGALLGQPLSWASTGGVSDGNILAHAGLPTLDTLGPRGGFIHTNEEYLIPESLVEKSLLVTLFICSLL